MYSSMMEMHTHVNVNTKIVETYFGVWFYFVCLNVAYACLRNGQKQRNSRCRKNASVAGQKQVENDNAGSRELGLSQPAVWISCLQPPFSHVQHKHSHTYTQVTHKVLCNCEIRK